MDQPYPTSEAAHEHDAAIFWAIAVPAAAIALTICLSIVIWLVPSTLPVQTERFLASACCHCRPEPREGIGYLASIVAPIVVFWSIRVWSPPQAMTYVLARLAAVARWLVALAVIGILLYQEFRGEPYWGRGWFLACLAASIVLAGARLLLFSRRLVNAVRVRLALPGWLAGAAAVAFTTLALLPTLYRASQPNIPPVYEIHTAMQMDEFAAATEGRTALVDFFPQYQNLLAYLLGPAFHFTGLSFGSFSIAMSLLSLLALFTIYRAFSAVAGSPTAGLMWYVPFLCISMAPLVNFGDALHQQMNTFNYYAVGPLRYFGPCVLVGVLVWYLSQPSKRRLFLLYLSAGLVAINNLDFGLPALGATLAATLLADEERCRPSLRTIMEVVSVAILAVGSALLAFVAFTRLRCGAWPQLAMATLYQRIYAVNGYAMLPMPACGLHWIVYVTFMAAIGRALFDHRVVALHRGMLLYSGVFGLGAFMYFVGRSHHNVLITIFPAWGLAFTLLCMHLNLGSAMVPSVSQCSLSFPLTLLTILGLSCSLVQGRHIANPWQQLERLETTGGRHWAEPTAIAQFIQQHTRPHERVIVACRYGHIIAMQADVTNVFPFAEPWSIILKSQLDQVSAAIDRGRITQLFGSFDPDFHDALVKRGFSKEIDMPGCSLWTRTALASRSPQPGVNQGGCQGVARSR